LRLPQGGANLLPPFTEYEYDPVGNLISIIDANDRVSIREYDELNRLIGETDPCDNTSEYRYDEVGNLIEKIDAMDRTTTYKYDELNRLTDVNYPDDTSVHYGYDENGNRIAMTDWNGSSSFEYDELNRLTASVDAFSNRVEYEYDPAGNRSAIVYPDSNSVSYQYDDAGKLQKVTDWNNRITTYTYDTANHLKSVALPNSSIQLYDYDDASRLISVDNNDVDINSIGSFQYTLDAVGNCIEVNEIATLSPIIPYSDVGYTYDDADRLITGGDCNYDFDDNGNQIERNCSGWITSYSYDSEDRLVSVSEPDLDVQHTYDGLGNRIARTVDGTEKKSILDLAGSMSQVLCETDDSNNITAYYIYGAGLIAKISPNGDERYYHYDGLGSTVALTDVNGILTDRYAYTPFGELANSEGSTRNPFKYVGRFGVMTEPEPDGTLFMRARFYDPATGRFLSKDPVEGSFNNPLSLHDYLYASANPIVNIDPQGEFFLESLALGMTFETITVVFELGAAAGIISDQQAADVRLYGEGITTALSVYAGATAGPAAAGLSWGGDWIGRAAIKGYVILGRDYIGPLIASGKTGGYRVPGHRFPNVDVHATTLYEPPTEELKTPDTKVGMPENYPNTHMDLPWTVPVLPQKEFEVDLNTNTPRMPSVNPRRYSPTHTSTTRKYR